MKPLPTFGYWYPAMFNSIRASDLLLQWMCRTDVFTVSAPVLKLFFLSVACLGPSIMLILCGPKGEIDPDSEFYTKDVLQVTYL